MPSTPLAPPDAPPHLGWQVSGEMLMRRFILWPAAGGLIVMAACSSTDPAPASSLTIVAADPVIAPGEQTTLTAGAASSVTWLSRDTAVATVSPAGAVTGVRPGAVVIVGSTATDADSVLLRVAVNFTSLAVGSLHTCGLRPGGGVHCWGRPALDSDLPLTALGGGGVLYQCGVPAAGGAFCWGTNGSGRLGTDSVAGNGDFPPQTVLGGHLFTEVNGATDSHTCGITADGEAWCWGQNAFGELGVDTPSVSFVPRAVDGGLKFTDLGLTTHGTCGVTTAATIYCWGISTAVAGSGPVPRLVPGPTTFTHVTMGGNFACGLTTDSLAFCWGENTNGELGTGFIGGSLAAPALVVGGLRFVAIEAHDWSVCALRSDGRAYCWGRGTEGQLGTGASASSGVPLPVAGDRVFASLAPGAGDHSCAVTPGGSGFCWGSGPLGDGTTASNVPVRIALDP
jgi:alpha-tubulin suppressor-like RCC1 family protein